MKLIMQRLKIYYEATYTHKIKHFSWEALR